MEGRQLRFINLNIVPNKLRDRYIFQSYSAVSAQCGRRLSRSLTLEVHDLLSKKPQSASLWCKHIATKEAGKKLCQDLLVREAVGDWDDRGAGIIDSNVAIRIRNRHCERVGESFRQPVRSYNRQSRRKSYRRMDMETVVACDCDYACKRQCWGDKTFRHLWIMGHGRYIQCLMIPLKLVCWYCALPVVIKCSSAHRCSGFFHPRIRAWRSIGVSYPGLPTTG